MKISKVNQDPFHDKEFGTLVESNNSYDVYLDEFPVSSGHLNYVSKTNDDSGLSECLLQAIKKGKSLIGQEKITGFNVGINWGESAGTDSEFPYVHLIPRRDGDCLGPFGGIRKVIDGQGNYMIEFYNHPDGIDIREKQKKLESKYNIHPPLFGSGTIPGWFNEYDIESIEYIVEKLLPEQGQIVEVGSFLGKSSVAWAEAARKCDKKYKILAIDGFNTPLHIIHQQLVKYDFEIPNSPVNHLELFYYYTQDYPEITTYQTFFDENFKFHGDVDCVFEDSSVGGLEIALPFWWERIRPGGILCVHDYREFSEEKKVVDLFAIKNKIKVHTIHSESSVAYIQKEK